jgi:hypothetical protein
MTLPDTDDILLFGSLAAFALGVALVVAAITGDALLAAGMALVGFGLPTAAIVFMAATETSE